MHRTWDVAPMGTWTRGTALHARLVALWDAGLSTAEIGRRLGYSKNAIVGAAHRLGLSGRPSPIAFHTEPSPRALKERAWRAARRVAQAPTLPPLASAAPTPHAPTRSRAPRIVSPKQPRPVRRPPPVAASPAPAAPVTTTVHACLWPIGEPGTRGFRFCDAARSRIDRPYCQDHCLLAYVGFGKWRSDAARALERAG